MTRTFPGPPARRPGQAHCDPGDGPPAAARAPRSTRTERAFVLGGFAVAALCTAFVAAMGGGLEAIAFIWMAAGAWAFVSSLALALRHGLRDRDWSPFRRARLPDDTELIDWSTQSGRYLDMALAEDNERLMRRD